MQEDSKKKRGDDGLATQINSYEYEGFWRKSKS